MKFELQGDGRTSSQESRCWNVLLFAICGHFSNFLCMQSVQSAFQSNNNLAALCAGFGFQFLILCPKLIIKEVGIGREFKMWIQRSCCVSWRHMILEQGRAFYFLPIWCPCLFKRCSRKSILCGQLQGELMQGKRQRSFHKSASTLLLALYHIIWHLIFHIDILKKHYLSPGNIAFYYFWNNQFTLFAERNESGQCTSGMGPLKKVLGIRI